MPRDGFRQRVVRVLTRRRQKSYKHIGRPAKPRKQGTPDGCFVWLNSWEEDLTMSRIPDPNAIFPNEYKTSCFIRNVVKAPNISIGEYTYYDDARDPTGFERNNVLFNYPEFGDRLIIGKFCAIAAGTVFVMGPANHRISSATTYPFNVFGGAWRENTPDHMAQLPRKGDTIV